MTYNNLTFFDFVHLFSQVLHDTLDSSFRLTLLGNETAGVFFFGYCTSFKSRNQNKLYIIPGGFELPHKFRNITFTST